MAGKQGKVVVPGFLFLLRSEENWIALSNACLSTGIINSQADTDPNLGVSDTCLKLGGIWVTEHSAVTIQERSHNIFPTVSSDDIVSFCRGDMEQSVRHSKKKKKKYMENTLP